MNHRPQPLQLAVIGCGDIAVHQHLPAILANPDVELAALCDRNLPALTDAESQFHPRFVSEDYRTLLARDDIDAIIVATPPWVTSEIVPACLTAGKNVLCEKPIAVTLEAGERIVAAEKESTAKLQVGFTYRHGPLMETLRDWIAAGLLGTPLIFRMGIFDEVWDPENQPEHYHRIFETMKHGSPSIHDGAHVADFLYFLTGSTPVRVEAYGVKTRPEFPATNYDLATVLFQNGALAKIEIGWFLPVFPKGEFEVIGPKGIAIFDRSSRTVELRNGETRRSVVLEEDWIQSCFRIQLKRFIEAIVEEKPCMPDGSDGLDSLRLTKSIEREIRLQNKI